MTKIKVDNKDILNRIYEKALLAINAGKELSFEISEYKDRRSMEQNSFYWTVCADIAKFFNEAGIKFKKIEYNKQMFDVEWNSDAIHMINKIVFGLNTTTKLNKQEFADYMDKLFNLWLEKTKGQWLPSYKSLYQITSQQS